MKYRKKPVIIEATQWFSQGDHHDVTQYEARCNKFDLCPRCGQQFGSHGWIDTFEGGHIVCIRDWIITGIKGEHYPCKPDIFEQTYEAVIDESV